MAFSNQWKSNFQSALFGSQALPSIPATLYLAAFTVLPDDAGSGGTEASGGSYARVPITNNTTNFPTATAANPSLSKLHVAFSFAAATADWSSAANIVGFGLYDAITSGTFIASAYALSAVGIATPDTSTGTWTFGAAHGRTTNDAIGIFVSSGGTIPTGFSAYSAATYYVIAAGLTSTAFRLAATQGGSAIVPSTVGNGAFFLGLSYVAPVRNGNTLTLPIDALQFSLTGR